MPWLKLDDNFMEHPKVAGLSARAFRAFVLALLYSAKHLTDGLVPAQSARFVGSAHDIEELVEAGLLERDKAGFRVHDYLDYQPSREQVLKQRQADAERQRRWRDNGRTNGVTPEYRERMVKRYAAIATPEAVNERIDEAISARPGDIQFVEGRLRELQLAAQRSAGATNGRIQQAAPRQRGVAPVGARPGTARGEFPAAKQWPPDEKAVS